MDSLKWHKRFLRLVSEISTWSKDDSTKVGAYIIDSERRPISHGYNGPPRKIDDSKPERYKRPQKYFWFEHAERNAIYNSTSIPKGCTIYITHPPCADCARAIIQKDIARVVINRDNMTQEFMERLKDTLSAGKEMLLEAGIEVLEISLKDE